MNIQNNIEFTPFHYAVIKGHSNIVKILFSKGADVNIQDKDGNIPLHYAKLFVHKRIVKDLLDMKANVDLPNMEGITSLYFYFAIKGQYKEAVRVLLEKGAKFIML
ncbi:MAG: ankyrin repeat domain-containing protein [Rickettsiales endosymbiont of Dermacentor nuttalli]